MTLDRPKQNLKRVTVIARDAETGKSKSFTVYGSKPSTVIAKIEQALAGAAEAASLPPVSPEPSAA